MTSPLPALMVLVGFANKPMDDPTDWIVDAPGVAPAVNHWTDISLHVENVNIQRGRQHELDRFQAGTCDLAVRNESGQFNAWNTSGPFYGYLLPRKQLRVIATPAGGPSSVRFTGFVSAWPVQWPDPVSQWATIEAADAFRGFNTSFVSSTAYFNSVLSDKPDSYWRLGDPSGSPYIADATARGHIGAVVAGTSSTVNLGFAGALSTDPDTAADFGSANASGGQGYIDVTPWRFSASGISCSVECWAQTGANVAGTVIAQTDPPGHTGWKIVAAGGSIQLFVTGLTTMTSPTLFDGWHHIVMAYTAGVHIELWVDGGRVSSSPLLAFSQAGASMWIGGDPQLGAKGGVQVDEVAIYRYALSSAQISRHWAFGKNLRSAASGQYIGELLSVINWPVQRQILDTGVQTCVGGQGVTSTTMTMLAALQYAELTEGGALYMDRLGNVRFIERDQLYAYNAKHTVPQAWFSDVIPAPAANTWRWGASAWGSTTKWSSPDAIPYEPGGNPAMDDLDVINQVVITRHGGVQQIVANFDSQAATGTIQTQLSDLLHSTDRAAWFHARWIVDKQSTPVVRLRQIKVSLLDALSKASTIFALDLMYRVSVERSSVAFKQIGLIEAYQEQITPDSWDFTFSLSPTDIYPFWQWGNYQ